MKSYLYDKSQKREHMVRVCEMKLCEAFNNYCSCISDSHKNSIKKKMDDYYNESVQRGCDLEALRYDSEEDWDLNYNDYDEEIINEYITNI